MRTGGALGRYAFIPGFFNLGSPEPLGSRQHNTGAPPEVIQMLRTKVHFNSPVQICFF